MPDEGDPARRDVAPCQARKNQRRRHRRPTRVQQSTRHRRSSTTTACYRYHRLWVTLIAIQGRGLHQPEEHELVASEADFSLVLVALVSGESAGRLAAGLPGAPFLNVPGVGGRGQHLCLARGQLLHVSISWTVVLARRVRQLVLRPMRTGCCGGSRGTTTRSRHYYNQSF